METPKPTGGRHKTPRRAVQLPADWYTIIEQLAHATKTPVTWWVIDVAREQALARGWTALPPVPWGTPLPPPPAPEPRRRKGR
jgi:hypothetical protein